MFKEKCLKEKIFREIFKEKRKFAKTPYRSAYSYHIIIPCAVSFNCRTGFFRPDFEESGVRHVSVVFSAGFRKRRTKPYKNTDGRMNVPPAGVNACYCFVWGRYMPRFNSFKCPLLCAEPSVHQLRKHRRCCQCRREQAAFR